MDLRTRYLGLELENPLVVSASPISESLDNIRRLEDAGASAIVNYSLMEEEITEEVESLHHHFTYGTESFAESVTYFPEPAAVTTGPEEYLEHIRKAKEAVNIPIIASLNGNSPGGWTRYAVLMEEAGADAIELNVFFVETDPAVGGEEVEQRYLELLRLVKDCVRIPVSVKLSPFFTSMASMATRLDQAGADGLVLFNRFHQPDIDLDSLQVVPNVILSNSAATRLPMRWIAILHGRIQCSLAATSGVHGATDVLKMLMAGADVTMLCSVLLKRGIPHLARIRSDLEEWMVEHEYDSVRQMQGCLSQRHSPDPRAFERANYIRALRTYHIN